MRKTAAIAPARSWRVTGDTTTNPSQHLRYECRNLLREVTQQPLGKGVTIMSGKTDIVKGRIKEAAGALTGSDKLRDEGKTDQAVGETKQAIQKVVDKVKNTVDKVIER